MSDRAHIDAWKATVTILLDDAREVLTHDEAQARLKKNAHPLPGEYVLVRVMHRYGAPRNAYGRTPMRGWRALLTIVGDEDERAWARERLDALQDARIEAIGTGPVSHESDDDLDDGSLLTQWTYET